MRSLWSDSDADAAMTRYGDSGVSPDLALRVYTSRLLGGDPSLVLHGGGNTSVKTVVSDLVGDLCVRVGTTGTLIMQRARSLVAGRAGAGIVDNPLRLARRADFLWTRGTGSRRPQVEIGGDR